MLLNKKENITMIKKKKRDYSHYYSIVAHVTPEEKKELGRLALSFGFSYRGKPSWTKLLKGIARNEYLVTKNPDAIATRPLDKNTAQ